jgi:hypothetical protein
MDSKNLIETDEQEEDDCGSETFDQVGQSNRSLVDKEKLY